MGGRGLVDGELCTQSARYENETENLEVRFSSSEGLGGH